MAGNKPVKQGRTGKLEAASDLIRQGALEEAESMLRALLKARPRDADCLYLLGLVRHFQHRHEEAEELLRRAIKRQEAPQYLTALGEARRARGAADAAEKAFLRALALAPRDFDALYNLAGLKMQQGAYHEAAGHYARLTQLAPHDYEIVSALGFAKMLGGDAQGALPPLEKAAKMRPNAPVVLSNLALGRFHAGDWHGALEAAEKALALEPGDGEMLYVAAQARIQSGRDYDTALIAFESYCREHPEDVAARLRLGYCHAAIGAFEAASDDYRAVLTQVPGHPLARLRLLTLDALDPDPRETEEMMAFARSGKLEGEDAINLSFALANLLEKRGKIEQAFEFYKQANDLRSAERRWDPARFTTRIARIREMFDGGIPDRLAGAGIDDEAPIFILGMPRSGSSLVEQILAAHPQVHGAGELPDMLGRPETYGLTAGEPDYPDFLDLLGTDAAKAGAARYLERLHALAPGVARITDKLPGNFQYLGLIAALLPKAKVIHSLRDPLDTCFSCYATDFGSGQGFTFDLAALGEYFDKYQELMAFWRERLPIVILDVSYEALIDDPKRETARILEHCGLSWDDSCLRPHEAKRPVFTASMWQVRQPIYTSAKGRAEPFRRWLEPALGWTPAPE